MSGVVGSGAAGSGAAGRSRATRRQVLAAAGGLAVAGVAAACSDAAPAPPSAATTPPGPAPTSSPVATPPPGPTYPGDLAGIALAAALSNLAADLYARGVAGATGNRYGPVPGVVTSFLSGASVGQSSAARAWNELLVAAGRPAVTGTPLTVADGRRAALDRASTPVEVLLLAHDLETAVAATVVGELGLLVAPAALAVGAGLAPVAAMRAATAAFLLGRPPGAVPGPDAAPLDRRALTV